MWGDKNGTTTTLLTVQAFWSVTVTVYVPETKFEIVCAVDAVDHKKLNEPTPPIAEAVIEPLLSVHLVGTMVVVISIESGCEINCEITENSCYHP